MLSRKRSNSGSALIELIVSITVLGLALLTLIYLFFNLASGVMIAQTRSTANFLAQELMEEIVSKRFDEKAVKTLDASSNLVWSTLGTTDTGETAGNKSTYDDVDDFDGWSETLASPYANYARTATVFYVSPANLDTQVTVNGTQQDYKRIRVVVSRGGVNYANLVTIKSAKR